MAKLWRDEALIVSGLHTVACHTQWSFPPGTASRFFQKPTLKGTAAASGLESSTSDQFSKLEVWLRSGGW